MIGRLIPTLAALALVVTGADPAAAQFKPTRTVEFVVHGGPGSGNDVFARQLTTIIDQEKLAPVRFQVVNKPGGGSTTAANYVVEQEERCARHRLLHQYLADRSAGAAGRGQPPARHEPDRAAGGRAGAGGGARGFAVQDARAVHRGGEGQARQAALVGRLDHVAREHRAAAADAGDRRALGSSSRSRPAASASRRCSAAMSR